MSPPVYNLSGVKKSYDGRTVLDIDELQILPGEILAVVGPSGSGKSTLLRLLNFLETPDEGAIDFNGKRADYASLPLALRRKITTVFQKPVLINTSVRKNVELGLSLRGIRDSRKQVERILELVGLGHLAEARARSLSGGEAQRVALARAIILQPEVLLLDEPTANLDPSNVEIIERVIRQLSRDHTTTIVLVTHNVFQARRLAGRVALLLNGRIVETKPTGEFFECPEDPRTAAFLRGEMIW